jgi:NTE family protein
MYTNMLGLDVGITGSAGELRIGPYISDIRGEPDFGIATSFIPGVDLTQSGILLVGIYDQLDRVIFPRSGFFTSMRIKSATEQGTTNDDYLRAQLTMTGVFSLDKNTFSGHLEWGDEISGTNNLPVYESFKLGGPRRLSGLYLDQLNGSEYNLATLSYYRQYASLPPQLGRGMYLGMSLEAGRINDSLMKDPWDWVSGGSVYWGADTILGSIYVGYGLSSLNQSTWYLVIGPHF